MASFSYSPEPTEGAYYEGLFRTADVQGSGKIGGGEAVQFFARSKLPIEILKSIWTVADQPSTSYLDHPKFAVAVRLIQLTQNGQKGNGPNLGAPPGVTLRPVFFEGVSGVSVPLPGQQQQQQQPPPTPQQMQRSPPRPQAQPQQQQQPQQPQQQQQQMQMHSPTMSSAVAPPTPSRALVGPDPYSMTPQERARYESLFPQYAKADGFVYGPEAVALFTKSGVDPVALRDIWNMVDRAPVDNRLDKLEFALAMHLIVCVSKKNLPLPSGGALPNSLRALKAVQGKPSETAASSISPTMAPQQQQPGQVAPVSPMSRSQMPPPQQLQQPHQQAMQQQYQQPPIVETVEATPMTGGPPPVEASGGMDISDAFEGLNMGAPEMPTGPEPTTATPRGLPSYVPEVPTPAPEPAAPPVSYSAAPPTPAMTQPMIPEPAVAPVPTPAAPQTAPSVNTANYDLGDAHSELGKLKGALQKLQAENISLKAQLGNMTDEEKDVQRELGATVAEIGKLTNELHGQRQKVLDAKNKLLEASAELKSHQEHKSVLTDLIAEATQTETAILEATGAMKDADQAAQHQTHEVKDRSDMFESSLFGYEESKVSTAPGPAPVPAQTEATETMHAEPTNTLETAAPPTPGMAPQYIPEPAPPIQQSPMPTYGAPSENALAPAASPSPGYYNYGAPPLPVAQQPESFINDIPQQAQATPTNLERPVAVTDHHRQDSGFGSGFVMGGSAAPIPQEQQPSASLGAEPPIGHSAARTHSSSGDYGFEDEESYKVVEDLKKQAERAAETARDAEAASSKLAAEADELRTDADRADANSRTLRAAADEKKKGRFGGGKKKAANREAERASEDAIELRKRFMAVQTQAQDAQRLAADTRREANRVKDEAEKAEIDMASAASLRDQQKSAAAPAPTPAAAPIPPPSNGYGHPPVKPEYPSYGHNPAGPPANGYGYGQPMGPPEPSYGQGYGMPPPSNSGYPGMSLPSADGAYAAGVMGGGTDGNGGFDLPSPNQIQPPGGSAPYSANPF